MGIAMKIDKPIDGVGELEKSKLSNSSHAASTEGLICHFCDKEGHMVYTDYTQRE